MTASTKDSKHIARELGWELERTTIRFQGKMFQIREDQLRVNDGEHLTYQYEQRSPGVIIVPVTAKGEIVLIRQYRYPVDAWCLEVPAGGCHDTGDMKLDEVAAKELQEEIGAEAECFEALGSFYTAPSFADEKCQVFIAWNTRLENKPDREGGEEIETKIVSAEEAFRLARIGEIHTAPCALALFWAEPHVLGRFKS